MNSSQYPAKLVFTPANDFTIVSNVTSDRIDRINDHRHEPMISHKRCRQISNSLTYKTMTRNHVEHDIRRRPSPFKSMQRHESFSQRNPNRISNVLNHDADDLYGSNHDRRTSNDLPYIISSDNFNHSHVHNVSLTQSSYVYEGPINSEYCATPVIISEYSPCVTPVDKSCSINNNDARNVVDHDSDLSYMRTLLSTMVSRSYLSKLMRKVKSAKRQTTKTSINCFMSN
jgi:hypothetical protein